MARYLGIDASTQSVSALVWDSSSLSVVAEASVNFGADLPHYSAPQGFIPGGADGEVHADPRMWLEALDLCLDRLAATGVDMAAIDAVSGAGQQHGTVYLNDSGIATLGALSSEQPLAAQFDGGFSRNTSPIWMDTSTGAQCRAIEAAVAGAEEVRRISGSSAVERFSGPQIRRFAETDPAGYAATVRIHLVSSFFASVLAGADSPIDHGDGAGMNLLNLTSLDWDDALLEATAPGLRDKLPAAAPSQTDIGAIAPYFVARHGFSPTTRVVAFTGDNPSSLVGTNAATPGRVVISLGTSDTFFASMPKPFVDPDGCGHVFGNPLGGFMTLQCFLNGSLAREKVRDALGMDWDAFSNALQSTPVGNDGKRMLPFFGPEISPRVNAEAPVTCGPFAGDDWKSDPAAARSCVEGQFLNMRLTTGWMQLDTSVVHLTGGASRNDAIAQIVADVFGAEVKRLDVSGSVALGGALRAALATGGTDSSSVDAFFAKAAIGETLKPNASAAAVYESALGDIRSLVASLRG